VRLFNSMQITGLFAGFPFLLSWISDATFRYSGAAFWAALAAYVVSFFIMWACVYDASRKDGLFDL
jgi:hypothetical protein